MNEQIYTAAPKEDLLIPFTQLVMENSHHEALRDKSTGITGENIKPGDGMAVVYDEHWRLARNVSVDGENQNVRLEFLHPVTPMKISHLNMAGKMNAS